MDGFTVGGCVDMTQCDYAMFAWLVTMQGRDLEHERHRHLSPGEIRWMNALPSMSTGERRKVRDVSRRAAGRAA